MQWVQRFCAVLPHPGSLRAAARLLPMPAYRPAPCLARPPAGCTVGALALGRFVFLPFHRASLAKAGMPKQNGMTHLQASTGAGAWLGTGLVPCRPLRKQLHMPCLAAAQGQRRPRAAGA